MWLEQRLGAIAMTSDDMAPRQDTASGDRRGESTLRHMVIAAVIAIGLVALWLGLMLLPV